MQDFLLEIGTEEIPASFLKPAIEALEQGLSAWFRDSRIGCGAAEVFYTPRRLAVRFRDVAEGQEARTVELQGPPKRAAFDPQGAPTKTAFGFAQTHGRTVADLVVKTTPKGEYVFVTKTLPAQLTGTLLAAALPEIIARLPFPKNMRWSADGFRFARPIRWLVALLGKEVVEFGQADVRSGKTSHGHRRAEPNSLPIEEPGEYEAVLARLKVSVRPEQRRQDTIQAIQQVLDGTGGELIPDDELLDETVNIVEAPMPVLCRFREEYLGIPATVIVAALKKHQRCFAVRDRAGKLLPLFVAVTNTPSCDAESVKLWYEKAAESRLKDASFFIEEDRKVSLSGYLEQESKVTWMEEHGSLRDKTGRLVKIAGKLAESVPEADVAVLQRAALLGKADLLSNMVREKEYTSLQGVMGGIYAEMQGEPKPVAQAIAEHYAPRSIGDPLPTTVEGKLLSVADKLDNLGAAFAAGAIPTGSVDPFALRRQTTGLLTIVQSLGCSVNLQDVLRYVMECLGNRDEKLFGKVAGFVRERLNLLLGDQGIKYDVANAVLEVSWQDPADARVRAEALGRFRGQEGFEKLVGGQKRVANILRGTDAGADADSARLAEPLEQALFTASHALEPELVASVAGRDYDTALARLLSLREVIDRFFDDVMVMCEDPARRANRLALLNYVKTQFRRVADLSQIVIESA